MESAHFIIPPGSGTWWLGLAFVALYGCVIWSWGTAGGQQSRRLWERVWAAGIFLFWLGGQMFLVMQGWWRFNNDLPLHLCGISNLLSVACKDGLTLGLVLMGGAISTSYFGTDLHYMINDS